MYSNYALLWWTMKWCRTNVFTLPLDDLEFHSQQCHIAIHGQEPRKQDGCYTISHVTSQSQSSVSWCIGKEDRQFALWCSMSTNGWLYMSWSHSCLHLLCAKGKMSLIKDQKKIYPIQKWLLCQLMPAGISVYKYL